MNSRELPLPGSDEAHAMGCTCPVPDPPPDRIGEPVAVDPECPVHGEAADARDRAAERGPVDTEGDIVDQANAPELKQG